MVGSKLKEKLQCTTALIWVFLLTPVSLPVLLWFEYRKYNSYKERMNFGETMTAVVMFHGLVVLCLYLVYIFALKITKIGPIFIDRYALILFSLWFVWLFVLGFVGLGIQVHNFSPALREELREKLKEKLQKQAFYSKSRW